MKIAIHGDTVLDPDTRHHIAAAPARVLGPVRRRVAELEMRILPLARSGKTLCQVTVHMANRTQVLGSDSHRDVRDAAASALRRARKRIGAALRRRRPAGLATA